MLSLGLVLVVVAAALLIVEAHVSTGGIVGAGAGAALVGGIALVLAGVGAGAPIVLAVAVVVAIASGAGLLTARRHLGAVKRRGPRSGPQAMVGHVGVVRCGDSEAPRVFVDGALWRADPSPLEEDAALHDGERVVVENVHGLTLSVRRAETWELSR